MLSVLSHLYTMVLLGALAFGPTAVLVHWKGNAPLFAVIAWVILFWAYGLGIFGLASLLIEDTFAKALYLMFFALLVLGLCALAAWSGSRIASDRLLWFVVTLPIAIWTFYWSFMIPLSIKRLLADVRRLASGEAD